MAIVYADVRLGNFGRPDLEEMTATAVVDSGAMDLVIPEHVALQLQLRDLRSREVTLADGSRRTLRYVGPVVVKAQGRDCVTGALVMGDQVLLGAIPLEAMDMIVHPREQRLIPNPENPNVPGAIVKWASGSTVSRPPGRNPLCGAGSLFASGSRRSRAHRRMLPARRASIGSTGASPDSSAVEILSSHPFIGRRVLGELRELPVSHGRSGYLALYRVGAALDVVRVLRIRHQREAGYRE